MRFEPIPKPTRSRFWIARRLWSMAGVIFAVLFLFFFLILPRIGHDFLLRNNYYGLGDHPASDPKNIKCNDSPWGRIDGHFFYVYPYAATISGGCLFNFKTMKNDRIFIEIRARRPHTFFQKMGEHSSELIAGSFKTISYKIYPIEQSGEGETSDGR